MATNLIPKREGPRREIATPVVPRNKPSVNPNAADATERALQQTARPASEARQAMWDTTARNMKNLGIGETIRFIKSQPLALKEVAVLVEEATQNRADVLRFFPKVGKAARDRYLPPTVPAKKRGRAAQTESQEA